MESTQLLMFIAFLQLVLVSHKGCVCTISCFTCSSRNRSDIDCEDPFAPGPHSYKEKCVVPKRGHDGEFPAHYCIKVMGTSASTHEKLVIRRCVLSNMDDQCGKFKLDNDTLHGCILTCDIDGCNSSVSNKSKYVLTYGLPVLATLCTFLIDSILRSYNIFSFRYHQRRKEKTICSLSSPFPNSISTALQLI
ncbi:unnamed protein product [Allacma fusca]|uniref:Protein quiver n=1 Tax=Allacma fusca TaxID=39272 RepID=A0A8J2PW69_9HEXA|nr:unnamed protein product [Allacma fusca]